MNEIVALTGGVLPWTVAVDMADEIRLGWIVAIGKYNGRDFDWQSMAFKEPVT